MSTVTKKRELLPKLNAIIFKFTKMAEDVAMLELDDSDACSRRVRTALIDVCTKEIPEFKTEITNIRMKLARGKKLPSENK